MAKKNITLRHLMPILDAIKKFVNSLVGEVAGTTADAIEELEGKLNRVEDKETGTVYTLSVENGRVYLDDGEGE